MSGKIKKAGTPVPKLIKEEPVISPVTIRKMNFAEGLDVGMTARKAFEKCGPAKLGDITYDRLKACVDGGLNQDEIIKAFSTTYSSLKKVASKVKFKFSEIKPAA